MYAGSVPEDVARRRQDERNRAAQQADQAAATASALQDLLKLSNEVLRQAQEDRQLFDWSDSERWDDSER
jgi:hypothetical protein